MLLVEGGTLLVTTTGATPDPFSRHIDLLLRAEGHGMELPDVEPLLHLLTEAGLRPETNLCLPSRPAARARAGSPPTSNGPAPG